MPPKKKKETVSASADGSASAEAKNQQNSAASRGNQRTTSGANSRKGGLGRGLGALIPSGAARPSLGSSAANVILGSSGQTLDDEPAMARSTSSEASPPRTKQKGASGSTRQRASLQQEGNESMRHSDENKATTKTEDQSSENAFSADKASGEDSTRGGARSATNPAADNRAKRRAFLDAELQNNPMGAVYRELPLDSIRANAKQPRTVFDEDALKELEHSIREFGVMQPIVVRPAPAGDSDYELIMGERRLRAAESAGLDAIPAIIRHAEDEAMLRDALLENIHRVELNPLEEAAAYQQLLEEFDVTQSELASRIGRSRPRITNMIRLLQLPINVQKRVAAGVISGGHARALLGLGDKKSAMEELAGRIITEGLSVRATEEAVILINREKGTSPAKAKPGQGKRPPLPPHVTHWMDELAEALETKVSVQMGKKKGRIVVEFGGPEDFERIAELLNLPKHS